MLWTVSSVWHDPDGGHGVVELSVLDAGPAGYWEVAANDQGITTLTVSSLERVMRMLRECVPSWCLA